MKTILFTFARKDGTNIEFVTAKSIKDAWKKLRETLKDSDEKVSHYYLQGGIE